jgi:hypothetical protein
VIREQRKGCGAVNTSVTLMAQNLHLFFVSPFGGYGLGGETPPPRVLP